VPDSDPPRGLDWDFYLGPAPNVPFNKNRFLRYYRWFWDYAGGWITDFGTHRLDTVQQVMGVEAPLSVNATGGRFSLKDDGEMPDVLQVTYEYPGFVLSYETLNMNGHGLGGRSPDMKYYMMRGKEDRPHGEAFYGTNGALFCDRIGFEIYPEPESLSSAFVATVVDRCPISTSATGFSRERTHSMKFFTCKSVVSLAWTCWRWMRKPCGAAFGQHRLQDQAEAFLGCHERGVQGCSGCLEIVGSGS
jgi:Oxidoreductase family, C-terminal alpha/beta domain